MHRYISSTSRFTCLLFLFGLLPTTSSDASAVPYEFAAYECPSPNFISAGTAASKCYGIPFDPSLRNTSSDLTPGQFLRSDAERVCGDWFDGGALASVDNAVDRIAFEAGCSVASTPAGRTIYVGSSAWLDPWVGLMGATVNYGTGTCGGTVPCPVEPHWADGSPLDYLSSPADGGQNGQSLLFPPRYLSLSLGTPTLPRWPITMYVTDPLPPGSQAPLCCTYSPEYGKIVCSDPPFFGPPNPTCVQYRPVCCQVPAVPVRTVQAVNSPPRLTGVVPAGRQPVDAPTSAAAVDDSADADGLDGTRRAEVAGGGFISANLFLLLLPDLAPTAMLTRVVGAVLAADDDPINTTAGTVFYGLSGECTRPPFNLRITPRTGDIYTAPSTIGWVIGSETSCNVTITDGLNATWDEGPLQLSIRVAASYPLAPVSCPTVNMTLTAAPVKMTMSPYLPSDSCFTSVIGPATGSGAGPSPVEAAGYCSDLSADLIPLPTVVPPPGYTMLSDESDAAASVVGGDDDGVSGPLLSIGRAGSFVPPSGFAWSDLTKLATPPAPVQLPLLSIPAPASPWDVIGMKAGCGTDAPESHLLWWAGMRVDPESPCGLITVASTSSVVDGSVDGAVNGNETDALLLERRLAACDFLEQAPVTLPLQFAPSLLVTSLGRDGYLVEADDATGGPSPSSAPSVSPAPLSAPRWPSKPPAGACLTLGWEGGQPKPNASLASVGKLDGELYDCGDDDGDGSAGRRLTAGGGPGWRTVADAAQGHGSGGLNMSSGLPSSHLTGREGRHRQLGSSINSGNRLGRRDMSEAASSVIAANDAQLLHHTSGRSTRTISDGPTPRDGGGSGGGISGSLGSPAVARLSICCKVTRPVAQYMANAPPRFHHRSGGSSGGGRGVMAETRAKAGAAGVSRAAAASAAGGHATSRVLQADPSSPSSSLDTARSLVLTIAVPPAAYQPATREQWTQTVSALVSSSMTDIRPDYALLSTILARIPAFDGDTDSVEVPGSGASFRASTLRFTGACVSGDANSSSRSGGDLAAPSPSPPSSWSSMPIYSSFYPVVSPAYGAWMRRALYTGSSDEGIVDSGGDCIGDCGDGNLTVVAALHYRLGYLALQGVRVSAWRMAPDAAVTTCSIAVVDGLGAASRENMTLRLVPLGCDDPCTASTAGNADGISAGTSSSSDGEPRFEAVPCSAHHNRLCLPASAALPYTSTGWLLMTAGAIDALQPLQAPPQAPPPSIAPRYVTTAGAAVAGICVAAALVAGVARMVAGDTCVRKGTSTSSSSQATAAAAPSPPASSSSQHQSDVPTDSAGNEHLRRPRPLKAASSSATTTATTAPSGVDERLWGGSSKTSASKQTSGPTLTTTTSTTVIGRNGCYSSYLHAGAAIANTCLFWLAVGCTPWQPSSQPIPLDAAMLAALRPAGTAWSTSGLQLPPLLMTSVPVPAWASYALPAGFQSSILTGAVLMLLAHMLCLLLVTMPTWAVKRWPAWAVLWSAGSSNSGGGGSKLRGGEDQGAGSKGDGDGSVPAAATDTAVADGSSLSSQAGASQHERRHAHVRMRRLVSLLQLGILVLEVCAAYYVVSSWASVGAVGIIVLAYLCVAVVTAVASAHHLDHIVIASYLLWLLQCCPRRTGLTRLASRSGLARAVASLNRSLSSFVEEAKGLAHEHDLLQKAEAATISPLQLSLMAQHQQQRQQQHGPGGEASASPIGIAPSSATLSPMVGGPGKQLLPSPPHHGTAASAGVSIQMVPLRSSAAAAAALSQQPSVTNPLAGHGGGQHLQHAPNGASASLLATSDGPGIVTNPLGQLTMTTATAAATINATNATTVTTTMTTTTRADQVGRAMRGKHNNNAIGSGYTAGAAGQLEYNSATQQYALPTHHRHHKGIGTGYDAAAIAALAASLSALQQQQHPLVAPHYPQPQPQHHQPRDINALLRAVDVLTIARSTVGLPTPLPTTTTTQVHTTTAADVIAGVGAAGNTDSAAVPRPLAAVPVAAPPTAAGQAAPAPSVRAQPAAQLKDRGDGDHRAPLMVSVRFPGHPHPVQVPRSILGDHAALARVARQLQKQAEDEQQHLQLLLQQRAMMIRTRSAGSLAAEDTVDRVDQAHPYGQCSLNGQQTQHQHHLLPYRPAYYQQQPQQQQHRPAPSPSSPHETGVPTTPQLFVYPDTMAVPPQRPLPHHQQQQQLEPATHRGHQRQQQLPGGRAAAGDWPSSNGPHPAAVRLFVDTHSSEAQVTDAAVGPSRSASQVAARHAAGDADNAASGRNSREEEELANLAAYTAGTGYAVDGGDGDAAQSGSSPSYDDDEHEEAVDDDGHSSQHALPVHPLLAGRMTMPLHHQHRDAPPASSRQHISHQHLVPAQHQQRQRDTRPLPGPIVIATTSAAAAATVTRDLEAVTVTDVSDDDERALAGMLLLGEGHDRADGSLWSNEGLVTVTQLTNDGTVGAYSQLYAGGGVNGATAAAAGVPRSASGVAYWGVDATRTGDHDNSDTAGRHGDRHRHVHVSAAGASVIADGLRSGSGLYLNDHGEIVVSDSVLFEGQGQGGLGGDDDGVDAAEGERPAPRDRPHSTSTGEA